MVSPTWQRLIAPGDKQCQQESPRTAHQRILVEQEEPEQGGRKKTQCQECTAPPYTTCMCQAMKHAEQQQLDTGEQHGNDSSTHPGIKEELRGEAPQQVGQSTGSVEYVQNVAIVEKEQLKLLLVVQMVWIGQPEEQQDGQSEKE